MVEPSTVARPPPSPGPRLAFARLFVSMVSKHNIMTMATSSDDSLAYAPYHVALATKDDAMLKLLRSWFVPQVIWKLQDRARRGQSAFLDTLERLEHTGNARW